MPEEPFEMPNPDKAPLEDLRLDDLGDLELTNQLVAMVKARIRKQLRSQWPTASTDDIEAAAAEMEGVQLRALRSGVVNYRNAYEVGDRIAATLQHRFLEA